MYSYGGLTTSSYNIYPTISIRIHCILRIRHPQWYLNQCLRLGFTIGGGCGCGDLDPNRDLVIGPTGMSPGCRMFGERDRALVIGPVGWLEGWGWTLSNLEL